jgi:hypothetical protein
MRTLPILTAAALALAGCTEFRSINPIADPGEGMENPDILGSWIEDEDERSTDQYLSIFRITADRGSRDYRVTVLDSLGGPSYLRLRPTRIGERLVFDIWPELDDDDLVLPLHTPYFVLRLAPDTIVLASLDSPEQYYAGGGRGSALAHMWMHPDSTAIVTASTAEIRRFLAQVQSVPGALGEPVTMRRLR